MTDIISHQPSAPTVPPRRTAEQDDAGQTKLPNGVVLGKDGKPCRLCTSAASWRAVSKQARSASSQAQGSASDLVTTTTTASAIGQNDCPPNTEELGRSTWTFLHSLAATYPKTATSEQQSEMRSFLGLFSRLYPCWVCAEDLQVWMAEDKNQPRLVGRKEFGNWMCDAHNEVNRKLGKQEFDCRLWEERWRTGWKDGRCD